MHLTRLQFLWMATLFEGALLVIALILGHWLSIDPLASFTPSMLSIGLGLIGALPLFGLFMASEKWVATAKIRELLIERMGHVLASCHTLELIYIGFLAGITEEFLFRGVIQPWLEQYWGWTLGLLFSNLIFALLHWITPVYGLMAGIAGLYLGLSLDIGPTRDLTVPVLIHAFYDFLAFVKVASLWRLAHARDG